jgi:hypothetical protein
MLNPRTKLLTSHPIALGARAGVLIDTGRFSIKKGSICLLANSELFGCKLSTKSGKTFRYSAKGTLRALQLGIDYTVLKTDLCWKILAWYGTFENGDRDSREKLFLDIKTDIHV